MRPTTAAEVITERCPSWVVDEVAYLGEGDFCTAFLVNGGWVFRFAKHENAVASLAREACLLPPIVDRFQVGIPWPEVVSLDRSPAFTAHRLLPGVELTRERYLGLPEPERSRCASQLGDFLGRMHATNPVLARECGVKAVDYVARYDTLLADARRHAFEHLAAPERSFVEAEVSPYVSSPSPSDFEPVVLHGDFSPEHVLYDAGERRVSGVIDFGDVVTGDPAWDLVYIYEDYGVDFLRRLLEVYAPPQPVPFLERAYRFAVLDAIEWVVTSAKQGSAELGDAIAALSSARLDGDRRLEQLLSVCAQE